MKIHALQVHPKEESLNGALYEMAMSYFEEKGHEMTRVNVYEIMPELMASVENVMFKGAKTYTANWANRHFDRTNFVDEEIERVLNSDMLYVQTPIWVYQMPAFLKLYIERIFVYHKFYRLYRTWREDYVYKPVPKNKKVQFCITMGGHPKMVDDMLGGDVDNLIRSIRHIFVFCGFEWLEPHIVFKTTAPQEEADDYLGDFKRFLESSSNF